MNVSLTPELERWIAEKVKSGLYKSSSEVVREGIRVLKAREAQRQALVQDLRQELLVGIQQLDAGKSNRFDEALVDAIKQTGRDQLGQ